MVSIFVSQDLIKIYHGELIWQHEKYPLYIFHKQLTHLQGLPCLIVKI